MKQNGCSTQPDSKAIVQINGKEFVRYSGLLDLAERHGLKSLEVEIVQTPSKANGHTAICKASAELESGKRASDLGEASPATMAEEVSKFPVSIASVRAKARCLRNLCGVSMTALEELGSFTDVIGEEPTPEKKPVQTRSTTQPNTQISAKPKTKSTTAEPKLITAAQKNCAKSMAKRQGLDEEALFKLCHEKFGTSLDNLSRRNASKFIEHLQDKAA